jgi:hypothetical protein
MEPLRGIELQRAQAAERQLQGRYCLSFQAPLKSLGCCGDENAHHLIFSFGEHLSWLMVLSLVLFMG